VDSPPLASLSRFADPALLILSSLADGDKHGYAITQDVEAISGQRLGPGTLYGALGRLETRGLIEATAPEGRRRPYRLTAAGRDALRAQLAALHDFSALGLARLGAA
jgi:DNA-binding PadR family transcriptional regulator